jgi:hypothetical protein
MMDDAGIRVSTGISSRLFIMIVDPSRIPSGSLLSK